jgi:hypothetical protein
MFADTQRLSDFREELDASRFEEILVAPASPADEALKVLQREFGALVIPVLNPIHLTSDEDSKPKVKSKPKSKPEAAEKPPVKIGPPRSLPPNIPQIGPLRD